MVEDLTGQAYESSAPCHDGAVRPLPPDPRAELRPGDGWVQCRCGQRHWGRYGAAGLLLWDTGGAPAALRVVLQHRALWSHQGGTWALPGGALDPTESAVAGALREAQEEAGLTPSAARPRAIHVLDHADWAYTTVLAEAAEPLRPVVSDPESLAVAWVALDQVADRPLLPAFGDALPELRAMVGRRLVLVVDAANTVGSRPDGWWRDRVGATERLRAELATLGRTGLPAAELDLPGHTWFPRIVLVTEGAARPVSAVPGVEVAAAPGEGDEEIVAQARDAADDPTNEVVVVTADRELRRRVAAVGARSVGPRLVRR